MALETQEKKLILKSQFVEIQQAFLEDKKRIEYKTKCLQNETELKLTELKNEIMYWNKKQLEELQDRKESIEQEISKYMTKLSTDNQNSTENLCTYYINDRNSKIEKFIKEKDSIKIIFEDTEYVVETSIIEQIPFLAHLASESTDENELYIFRSGKYFNYIKEYVLSKQLVINETTTQAELKKIAKEFQYYELPWKQINEFISCIYNIQNISTHGINYTIKDNVIHPTDNGCSFIQFDKDIIGIKVKVLNIGNYIDSSCLSIGYCPFITKIPYLGQDGYFLKKNGEIKTSLNGVSSSFNFCYEIKTNDSIKCVLNDMERMLFFQINENESSIEFVDTNIKLYPTIIMNGVDQQIEVETIYTPIL
ncbi:hypothetical protein EHI8A_080850 [Entamoeba histolytica HM-1:IMSS-B]|uniref:Uncharacterized protein n=6 Tax=Entamoeba histolytica TaxID=5759 RepID=C4M057_ENTH1|nr:hypothetical protein EHI_021430 [Entamoeba histolytica HM-1:IMSS]EMD44831.1 Hypothetical protein EHI5A_082760 [Entamoeba histolytica KU27]EMH72199.1 hypothetical protein EHI8A_080850 [Entamoeba histolytica HM-1:IMSS-B]EMS17184.1 hypothetical protein KM1_096680 [Entamoeba histolytica HM-3:IMSS]ENY65340.1 hypothetical protein EHI7A_050930 [Entamoeba histolytica HM-1:IMSS-A]GAT94527.1 hypothetical protein CL6EHI_021430 [Entamoeba histolytica]|eukprot:XP_650752.1 hypothetical protein EHI_021430 [Entamoeba histolytica HM-1:IMSS]